MRPPMHRALAVRADAPCELGRNRDAPACIDDAIRRGPRAPFAHMVRSAILCRMGRSAEGAESYDRAGECDPTHTPACHAKAIEHASSGRFRGRRVLR